MAAAIVELLVPKQENQRVPILELRVPSSRNCQFPNVGTSMSHSWNHGSRVLDLAVPKRWNQCYPTLVSVPGTSRSQTLEPMLPGLGTTVWSDVYTSFFCTCTRCCMKKAAKVLFNWPASKKWHVWKKRVAYWTDMEHMFSKILALFCSLVRYHRCVRNRHPCSDRQQKEGARLNKTYWPIT